MVIRVIIFRNRVCIYSSDSQHGPSRSLAVHLEFLVVHSKFHKSLIAWVVFGHFSVMNQNFFEITDKN